ncbi:protein kinase [Nocardia sp. CA2R105]|uniref:protein kinase domain-containing protein n=1 Tax=Nocardia coffeae TaxID=2873381 RepID=UPI001CA73CAB|nr:protein kinase [Nocardia coffeae]MBY8864037.1 protein kinase [Nocardia coffeae]
MTDDDPLRTHREAVPPVTVELAAAGFDDATEIGHGGFGVVYRCWQAALERTVAVKVLTAELDADNKARFVREQRVMGRLTGHPNIVTVLEIGATDSGRPFLVMPYHPLGSLDTWIRTHGPLPVERSLSIGVKIAGALESAHRLGIVHRDVKPANVLLTEYDEVALTDFGIAHIAGGFQTTAGVVTGSPAFSAPEVLEGEAPTPAADVYGLGATLFCALTGHAAFERRSGENMMAQFVRITTQPVPDLREGGIPEDVSAVVAVAMSRDRHERPTAATLGESLRQVQQYHGLSVGAMALQGEANRELPDQQPSPKVPRKATAASREYSGNLPLELTNFINRRSELSELKNRLSASRLVTLTGTGGVGKTRLALRAATGIRHGFANGVWLVELAEVSDPALLIDVVAATLGVRSESATPLLDVLIDFLGSCETLLMLDNCEQVVEAVAKLTETLLRACPELRILVTSRESLNIAGESVLRVVPLAVPDGDREPALADLPRFDAVTLFADRAAAAVEGFELDEDNKTAVAGICAHLDGLPLAIELAAARMRSMSPAQILSRITDRYDLLTQGSRTAPSRQQTMRWCIDWSYGLCTPTEQRLWARLSVFAGSCELDAVEQICASDLAPDTPLDVLSGLVDKSILIRQESNTVVRFRMLETMRDYGRQKLRESGEDTELRRRHRDWYQKLALESEAGWISHRQLEWIARLERELPNLREALEFCLYEDTEEAARAGLRTIAAMLDFWVFDGLHGEGRGWLNRALALPKARSVPERVKALCGGTELAAAQGDFHSGALLLAEARGLVGQSPTPAIEGQIAYTSGFLALARGDAPNACTSVERAVEKLSSDQTGALYVGALAVLGWAYELRGDMTRASEYCDRVLSITKARGEYLYRSGALRGLGVAAWHQGELDRAEQLLEESLRVNQHANSVVLTAFELEALAWTVADQGKPERAAVLLGAAQGIWLVGSRVGAVFPDISRFHEECERKAREALGIRVFDAAHRRGQMMGMGDAVAYALGEEPADSGRRASAKLTRREAQVAELIARGFSNKQIAAKLVISQRTAEGHVEHILTKLGFTSRAQVAVWAVKESKPEGP